MLGLQTARRIIANMILLAFIHLYINCVSIFTELFIFILKSNKKKACSHVLKDDLFINKTNPMIDKNTAYLLNYS